MPSGRWGRLHTVLGIPQHAPSWREQLAAVVTATGGMALLAGLALWLGEATSPWLLTSMGATAVLLFAMPHGPLSQPWSVIGGHLLSAIIALLVYTVAGSGTGASAVAVGLSIAAMHLARCIHPPGGATALYILQSAGAGATPQWSWLLQPVLVNVALSLLVATALNYPFPWRRYPAFLAAQPAVPAPQGTQGHHAPFTAEELAAALDDLDEVLDISDEQLQLLYEYMLARRAGPPAAGT